MEKKREIEKKHEYEVVFEWKRQDASNQVK